MLPIEKNRDCNLPISSHLEKVSEEEHANSLEVGQVKQLQSQLRKKNREIELLKERLKNKEAFSAMKTALTQLHGFLSIMPVAIYFKDLTLSYTYANQTFAAWTNIAPDELVGNTNSKLELEAYFQELEQIEAEVLNSGKEIQNREIGLKSDNQQFLINAYLFPMFDATMHIEGVMVCCFDLTERLQFEKEIKGAQNRALVGEKSKQTFLANLSHEIRTPLHGILGSSSLLQSRLDDSQSQELIENIKQSGTALLEMVEAMLLLESTEEKKYLIKNKPFKIKDLVVNIRSKYLAQAESKAIDLQCFLAQGLPEMLIGDQEKIQLLLHIFINNAIKFTEKGFVHVLIQLEKQTEVYYRINFKIKDTGIGIKRELHSDLFSMFTQVDSSSTKGYQGIGLGLATAEKICTVLGGEIAFESDEYKGSTFGFSLNLEKMETDLKKAETLAPGQLPVLLVEDNKINQKIAFFTLKKLGFSVEIAENGLEAIERFQEGEFRIVLMDIQMPKMNGFDATTNIRMIEKQKNLKPAIIIALSANTVKEDIENCFLVGMNEYISKPFSPEKLTEIIQRHLPISFQ